MDHQKWKKRLGDHMKGATENLSFMQKDLKVLSTGNSSLPKYLNTKHVAYVTNFVFS